VSGFLQDMHRSSAQRVAEARRREPLGALERRARQTPAAPALKLSGALDVIAELKLRSPAQGVLRSGAQRDGAHDWQSRVCSYARAGAAAVSVLTEPTRFDGSLEHLREAAAALAPLGVPAMRKDFVVDPYQVLEARAAGAGGVLLIARMLRREHIAELLTVAIDQGLFVLLEAFDAADLAVCRELIGPQVSANGSVLVGVNCRDLDTLKVEPARFKELAPLLPPHALCVAESGVATAADALEIRRLGYRLALIGTALMTREDPGQLLAEIFAATRTVQF
jgi:indole-3-glycerol phosphate synthase